MRTPCAACGDADGVVAETNGQDVVRCASCGKYAYCQPRTESGREVRSKRTRPMIKPSQRARILQRDNGTCVLCHRIDVTLDLGHLLSVSDGLLLGISEQQLYSDDNLAAMCDACNSGIGRRSLTPWLVSALLNARASK